MENPLHIKEQAIGILQPKSYRAVANAKNKILILVPCHRIIKSNLTIGGYLGGTNKKMLLIDNKKTLSKKYKQVMIFINAKHIFR